MPVERRRDRPAIVLADEDHGQLPDAGFDRGFVERSACSCALTEEDRHHSVLVEDVDRKTRADCERKARTESPALPHDADLGRGEVNGAAALAADRAGCPPE